MSLPALLGIGAAGFALGKVIQSEMNAERSTLGQDAEPPANGAQPSADGQGGAQTSFFRFGWPYSWYPWAYWYPQAPYYAYPPARPRLVCRWETGWQGPGIGIRPLYFFR